MAGQHDFLIDGFQSRRKIKAGQLYRQSQSQPSTTTPNDD
jgi:hypothetical protein